MKLSVLYISQGRMYKELLNLFQFSSFILMGIQLQGIRISLWILSRSPKQSASNCKLLFEHAVSGPTRFQHEHVRVAMPKSVWHWQRSSIAKSSSAHADDEMPSKRFHNARLILTLMFVISKEASYTTKVGTSPGKTWMLPDWFSK